MKLLFIKLFFFIGIFASYNSYGQFTYIEAGLNNTNIAYKKSVPSNSYKTHYHGFSIRINAISRIVRNFGVGGELNVPLAQGNSFNFRGAKTISGSSFSSFDDVVNNNRYVPQKFDYSFKNSISASLFVRIYLSTDLNPYVDIKISYLSITERFILKRDELPATEVYGNYIPNLPAVDIEYEKTHNLFTPGFAIGLQPHLSDKLFINFNIGFDIYNFGHENNGFSYPVVYDYDYFNDIPKVVVLESKATNTRAGLLINLGMGYFF